MEGLKMWYLYPLPLFIDGLQVINGDKPNIDFVMLLFAVIPALIGSIVRILHEEQKVSVSLKRKLFISICAVVLSYGVYEASDYFNISKVIGLLSIVVGVISVDLVNWMITELPLMFSDLFRYLVMRNKQNDRENDME